LHVDVETRGLKDLGVDATDLARRVLAQYAAQIDGIHDARTRVRGVP